MNLERLQQILKDSSIKLMVDDFNQTYLDIQCNEEHLNEELFHFLKGIQEKTI